MLRPSLRLLAVFLPLDLLFKPILAYPFVTGMRAAGPDEEMYVATMMGMLNVPATIAWVVATVWWFRPLDRWSLVRDTDACPGELIRAAGEAAYLAPRRFAVAWVTHWVAIFLLTPALLTGPFRDQVSLDSGAMVHAAFQLVAVALGSLALSFTFISWFLGDITAKISTLAHARGVAFEVPSLSVRGRLVGLAFCFAVAPTSWISGLAYTTHLVGGGQQESDGFNIVLGVCLVGVGVWAPLCASWLGSTLADPVGRMQSVISTITQRGEFSTVGRVPIQQRDEIGTLGEHINEMIERLELVAREREHMAESLVRLNRELEDRVETRTADLATSNRALTEKTGALEAAVSALRQSEALNAAVVEGASDAIVTYDEQGIIHDWNAAAEKVFGYSSEEMVGRSIGCLRPSHDDDLAPLPSGAAARHEYLAQDKGGATLPVEVSRSVVNSDAVQLTVALLRDLTEVKRTQARLKTMQENLLTASREAGMAQVATSVLHNVGNVLNSVNVSVTIASEQAHRLDLTGLTRAAGLLRTDDTRIADGSKLVQLAGYLELLRDAVHADRDTVLTELSSLKKNIEHIATIVAMQQSMAKPSGLREAVSLASLVEESLGVVASSLAHHEIVVVREFGEIGATMTERHKVSDILINLLSNARDSLRELGPGLARRLTVRLRTEGDDAVCEIADSGGGIAAENLVRVFSHGFTTKAGGHGFGLHASALFAKEMGGDLTCASEGVGKGATFTLRLPGRIEIAAESAA